MLGVNSFIGCYQNVPINCILDHDLVFFFKSFLSFLTDVSLVVCTIVAACSILLRNHKSQKNKKPKTTKAKKAKKLRGRQNKSHKSQKKHKSQEARLENKKTMQT